MKNTGKVLKMDYDALSEMAACHSVYFLSDRTKSLCLSLLHFAHWSTRYYSPSDAGISKDVVDAWSSQAEAELQGVVDGSLMYCEDGMDFCELVINCIKTGALDDTLRDWLKDNGLPPGRGQGEFDAPTSTENLVSDCDLDLLFGAVTQFVDLMHTIVTDFYEKMQSHTQWAEKLSYVLSALPVIGLLPFDEIAGLVGSVLDDFGQNYAAAYDEDVRLQYRCDLFCLASETCYLDAQGIGQYFLAQFGLELVSLDFYDLVDYILSGAWSGTEIVHLSHALVVLSWVVGSAAIGIEPDTFNSLLKSFFNDPDSDHTALCECEVVWQAVIPLNVPALPPYVTVNAGTFVPGVGIQTACEWSGTKYEKRAGVVIVPDDSFDLLLMSVCYGSLDICGGAITAYDQLVFNVWQDLLQAPQVYAHWKFGTLLPGSFCKERGGEVLGVVQLSALLRACVFNCDGDGYITSVTLQGRGVNPFL